MKTNTIYIILLQISLITTGCSQRGVDRQLAHVDYLVVMNRLDSAFSALHMVDKYRMNREDEALYNLLYTQIAYRTYKSITSDSLINNSVAFYKESNNKKRLCEAYLYKGEIENLPGRHVSAIVYMKKAETEADRLADNEILHKVYNGLVNVNYATANYPLALEYAYKELKCSKQDGNQVWMAYSYNHLSCVYDKLGSKDSVYRYIELVMPYVNTVPKESKAYHLTNIGQYYLHYQDTLKGVKYLTMAYQTCPITETANLLAQIAYTHKQKGKARRLWDEALKNSDMEGRIKIKQTMANIFYNECDYKAYSILSTQLNKLKDSLEQERRTMKIQELQLKYDHEEYDKNKNLQIVVT